VDSPRAGVEVSGGCSFEKIEEKVNGLYVF
jgi:hypothetical protein